MFHHRNHRKDNNLRKTFGRIQEKTASLVKNILGIAETKYH
jgi:hypothetical protein